MRRPVVWLGFAAWAGVGCNLLFNPDRIAQSDCSEPEVRGLEAIAGEGTALAFEWQAAPVDAGRFKDWQVCWGPSEASRTQCAEVPARCGDAGRCRLSVGGAMGASDGGSDSGVGVFRYNQRVYAEVVARDLCGTSGSPATVSATPINGTFADTEGLLFSTPSNCDAGLRSVGSGALALDAVTPLFLCIPTAMFGDEEWQNGTLEAEVRSYGAGLGGFALRAPEGGTTSPRNGVLLTSLPQAPIPLAVTRRESNGEDVLVASSATAALRESDWAFVRVTFFNEWIRIEMGPTSTQLQEVLRYRDSAAVTTARKGRLGLVLAVAGLNVTGRIEYRNLRVRTGAQAPDGGPTSASWTFGGLDGAKDLHLGGGTGNSALGTCPASFPPAAGCTNCDAGSQCVRVQHDGLASFSLPLGLNYEAPWKVSFLYAADTTDAFNSPSILRTTVVGPTRTNGFSGFPLIDSQGFHWMSPVRVFGNDVGTLDAGTWNRFELTFQPAQTRFELRRNGVLTAGSMPAGLGPHLGALVLGGNCGAFATCRAFFSDLSVTQPP